MAITDSNNEIYACKSFICPYPGTAFGSDEGILGTGEGIETQIDPDFKYPEAQDKWTDNGIQPPAPSDYWLSGHLWGDKIYAGVSDSNGIQPPSPSLSHPLWHEAETESGRQFPSPSL